MHYDFILRVENELVQDLSTFYSRTEDPVSYVINDSGKDIPNMAPDQDTTAEYWTLSAFPRTLQEQL